MVGRIVEVADERRYLFVSRGFMIVKETEGDKKELGKIPLDDISAVIGNAHGLSFSNNFLVALAERGAPFVVCGANHNAKAMLWPVDGNYQQAKRYDAQLSANKPLKKRLWADIIRSKLSQQAAVLEAAGMPDAPLVALIKKVRSGDTSNIEAQGARRYWNLLFGSDFRRDRNATGLNSMLNYGYTVYRAATARSVIAAGLHPTLGVFHQNEGNPMRLVDDLIEPFRPFIDWTVWQLFEQGQTSLTGDVKRTIVKTLYQDRNSHFGLSPTIVCMQNLATSLVKIYLHEQNSLALPLPEMPLSLAAS